MIKASNSRKGFLSDVLYSQLFQNSFCLMFDKCLPFQKYRLTYDKGLPFQKYRLTYDKDQPFQKYRLTYDKGQQFQKEILTFYVISLIIMDRYFL